MSTRVYGVIKKLIERLGFTVSTVSIISTFGGSDNDILVYAGIGIAMGNAHQDVKLIADYVTDSSADDDLEKALMYYNVK